MRWRRTGTRHDRPAELHPAGPGQESVWDYPRPPRAERGRRRVRIVHHDTLVLDTDDVVRVLETSHPPTYYLPRSEFRVPLGTAARVTSCEFKGEARYVDVLMPGSDPLVEVGWWYPEPDLRYPQLFDRVAVYAGPFDEITVDGEPVTSQPGDFYGGWITSDVISPFKGGAGSRSW